MAFIETVLGKIDPSNIGKTDAHDHLIRKGGVEVITNGSDFDMPNENKALEELELFKQVGGNTLVEMTPIGSGRSIESLREISAKSGVNIIATTGFHKSEFMTSLTSCGNTTQSSLSSSSLQTYATALISMITPAP